MAFFVSPGHRHFIVNWKSQTVVELSAINDHLVVVCNPKHGGESQQWEIIYDKGWCIRSVLSGKYLRFGGIEQPGSRLTVSESPFVWHFWPHGTETTAGSILVPGTGLYVDLSGYGNPAPGTPLEIWRRIGWGHTHQLWRFEIVQSGPNSPLDALQTLEKNISDLENSYKTHHPSNLKQWDSINEDIAEITARIEKVKDRVSALSKASLEPQVHFFQNAQNLIINGGSFSKYHDHDS